MGGDGQALLNNRKLLENLYRKGRGAGDAVNKHVAQVNRLRFCTYSHEPLEAPVCCDHAGHLYNLSAVVQMLMARREALSGADAACLPSLTGPATHIHRLKDVKELTLVSSGHDASEDHFELVCPVTGLKASAGVPFACNWRCGHAVSVQALGGHESEDWTARPCPVSDCITKHSESATPSVWVRIGLDDAVCEEQRQRVEKQLKTRKRAE